MNLDELFQEAQTLTYKDLLELKQYVDLEAVNTYLVPYVAAYAEARVNATMGAKLTEEEADILTTAQHYCKDLDLRCFTKGIVEISRKKYYCTLKTVTLLYLLKHLRSINVIKLADLENCIKQCVIENLEQLPKLMCSSSSGWSALENLCDIGDSDIIDMSNLLQIRRNTLKISNWQLGEPGRFLVMEIPILKYSVALSDMLNDAILCVTLYNNMDLFLHIAEIDGQKHLKCYTRIDANKVLPSYNGETFIGKEAVEQAVLWKVVLPILKSAHNNYERVNRIIPQVVDFETQDNRWHIN